MIPDLVQLQNVSLKLAQRITCDEEERQRFGYELVSVLPLPGDRRPAGSARMPTFWSMAHA